MNTVEFCTSDTDEPKPQKRTRTATITENSFIQNEPLASSDEEILTPYPTGDMAFQKKKKFWLKSTTVIPADKNRMSDLFNAMKSENGKLKAKLREKKVLVKKLAKCVSTLSLQKQDLEEKLEQALDQYDE